MSASLGSPLPLTSEQYTVMCAILGHRKDAFEIKINSNEKVSGLPFDDPYLNALCLIDTFQESRPPDFLVSNTSLFIIQAASPNPTHKEWRKRRIGIYGFVLNPPGEAEMTQASVLFFIHHDTN